jgi:uncharacterized protein (TIGR03437 family)
LTALTDEEHLLQHTVIRLARERRGADRLVDAPYGDMTETPFIPLRFALLCALALPMPAATAPLIDYVTYLGGSFADNAVGIAVDSTGSAYVAGSTQSPDFPLTSSALGAPSANNNCAFVTKLNPTGTAIDFSVCLANSSAIAFGMDANGNLYLLVEQLSNPFSASYAVVKLDPVGQTLLYNTPIDGEPGAMVVDAAGNVYVAGQAGPGLATTSGAYQPQSAGGQCPQGNAATAPCNNAFATKLDSSGKIIWSTYLGGTGPDNAQAIAVDTSGNVWFAGQTVSPNFPTTTNALSRTFGGEVDLGPLRYGDAFVSEFDPTGSRLLYSTYLGGSAPDAAFGIAVDSSGAAYVSGGTQSTNFPTTPGAYQTTYSGPAGQMPGLAGNGFVSKFAANGQLVYSTFLGNVPSQAGPIALDAMGQAYVSLAGVAQPGTTLPGCTSRPSVDVLNASGSAIAASSPIPGGSLALDGKGGLYSAGLAYALIFFSTPHAFQTGYGGGDSDAFAAKVDFSQPAGALIASVANAASFAFGYASQYPDGGVAPGEIVTIFGSGFPDQPAVSVNQYPAPVISAANCQINAVVPFGLAPGTNAFISVQAGEQTLGPVKVPVVTAAPGIFTLGQTGAGQAAVLNQDGTVNSASNPAARGSTVAVYMTGVGALTGVALNDGALGPVTPPFPTPIAAITATIDNLPAAVTFAGQAPGLIAGATQVNVVVPQNAAPGVVSISIAAAGFYPGSLAPGPALQIYQNVTVALK